MFNFLCDYLNYRIFSEERQYIYVIFSELYKKKRAIAKATAQVWGYVLLEKQNMYRKNYFLRFCKTQITAQTAEIMPHRVLISRLIINLKYLLSVSNVRT